MLSDDQNRNKFTTNWIPILLQEFSLGKFIFLMLTELWFVIFFSPFIKHSSVGYPFVIAICLNVFFIFILFSLPDLYNQYPHRRNLFLLINALIIADIVYFHRLTISVIYLATVFNFIFVIAQISVEAMIRKVRMQLELYLDPKIVEANLARRDTIRPGCGQKYLVVLFVDIRNFTRFSSCHTSEEVAKILNFYFSICKNQIHDCGGTVDKFIGDAVMAFFGDPREVPEPELAAVKAARLIQQIIQKHRTDFMGLHVGIGINAGDVLVGNFGCLDRLDYTVIGDNVNIASRLAHIAGPDEILVSKSVFDKIKDNVVITAKPGVRVKGLEQSLDVYSVSVTA